MSLRVAIQTKIIETLRDGTYPVVDYDKRTNLPVALSKSLTPEVVCNEIDGQINKAVGAASGYVMTDWHFEARVKFSSEVDVTEALMGFNFNFNYESGSSQYAVMIVMGSQYTPEHPPMDGSHQGTRVTLSFVVNVKK
jgi:hypothetical protein